MAGPAWLTARPIAHRGYHDRAAGRIENTGAAFAAAIARGFAIECDVRLTADDEVVVFHDDLLDRLTEETGRVDARPLGALRSMKLTGTDDRIPTLADLLDQVSGRVPIFVELKGTWNNDRRLDQAVADQLTAYAGPVAVMSFDPASMRAMGDLAPHIPRGMLGDRFDEKAAGGKLTPLQRFALRHLLAAATIAPQFVAYDVNALPANAPLLLRHTFGTPLLTWTVRTPEQRAIAARWADQIIFEGFDPAITPPGTALAGSP
jgi:glycerophosphoryl diester phosphodiesterase